LPVLHIKPSSDYGKITENGFFCPAFYSVSHLKTQPGGIVIEGIIPFPESLSGIIVT
jgi:hypothetical protein